MREPLVAAGHQPIDQVDFPLKSPRVACQLWGTRVAIPVLLKDASELFNCTQRMGDPGAMERIDEGSGMGQKCPARATCWSDMALQSTALNVLPRLIRQPGI